MCGSSALVAPPSSSDSRALSEQRRRSGAAAAHSPRFSRWLFFIGLSLVVTPALRVYAIVEQQIPMFVSEQGQLRLMQHPGLETLLNCEIAMNAVLVMAAVVLNFLFYARSKQFPKYMIAYVAVTFVYWLAVTAAVRSLFPDINGAQTAYSLVRYFIWGALTAGYLLFDKDAKIHFDR